MTVARIKEVFVAIIHELANNTCNVQVLEGFIIEYILLHVFIV